MTPYRLTLLIAALPAFGLACSDDSSEAVDDPVALVEAQRYQSDLKLIAQARPPGSAHWKKVQDLCVERFKAHGFTTSLHKYATGVNVIGTLTGTKEPAKQVIVSAHYDSTKGCAGADDNATGVAGLLEAARVLATRQHDRTLVVACWDEEERGLIGSLAYAKEAAKRKDQILTAFVFEMIGYKSDAVDSQTLPTGFELLFPTQIKAVKDNKSKGDFIAVIHDTDKGKHNEVAVTEMKRVAAEVGLPIIGLPVPDLLKINPAARDLQRSDHAAFWYNGIPGMMITDTSEFRNTHYHCRKGEDSVDRLDSAFATQVIKATTGAALKMLSASSGK